MTFAPLLFNKPEEVISFFEKFSKEHLRKYFKPIIFPKINLHLRACNM